MIDVATPEHIDRPFDEGESAARDWQDIAGQGDALLRSDGLADWVQPIDWDTFWAADTVDQEWLIEPIIPAGRQIATFSRAKTGKSLLALDAAAALATGRPILGCLPREPVDVAYFDMEMTEDDVRERLEDLGYGPDIDLSRLHYYLLPSLPPLDTDLGGQVLEAIAQRWNIRLAVVDTMARAVAGEENHSDTYRHFYRYSGRRLKVMKVALWRLDHGGKDLTQGQRGSSAKEDDVDVVFQLTVNADIVTLKRTHSRVPWVPAEIQLQRHTEPLRHVLATGLWPEGTRELADLLDKLDIPIDASSRTAGETLKRAGHGRRNTLIIAALKWRKQRP